MSALCFIVYRTGRDWIKGNVQFVLSSSDDNTLLNNTLKPKKWRILGFTYLVNAFFHVKCNKATLNGIIFACYFLLYHCLGDKMTIWRHSASLFICVKTRPGDLAVDGFGSPIHFQTSFYQFSAISNHSQPFQTSLDMSTDFQPFQAISSHF